jgi:excisionase family DNA binding protein
MENPTARANPEVLVSAVRVAERIGVTRRTISRWLDDESLNFPKPINIHKRLYIREADLNAWLAERTRVCLPARRRN